MSKKPSPLAGRAIIMIISHRHQFIYVKPRKTAGSSVQCALAEITGPEDIIIRIKDPQNADKFNFVDGHISLSEAFKIVPECRHYFVIATERNPWDKMISWFFFDNGSSFPQWLGKVGNTELYWDRPNYIIQYHRLKEDWLKLGMCLKINLPSLGNIRHTRHIKRIGSQYRPKKSYTYYYNDETKEIVRKRFAKEIEMYGYSFGGQDIYST